MNAAGKRIKTEEFDNETKQQLLANKQQNEEGDAG